VLNVALTGNIGRGQIDRRRFFQRWVRRSSMRTPSPRGPGAGGEVLAAIAGRFGADVLAPDGTLDPRGLRAR